VCSREGRSAPGSPRAQAEGRGDERAGPDVERLATTICDSPAWLFLLLALDFGVIAYFVSGENLARGVIGGLLFGLAISVWLKLRKHLWRS
jgi:hypothetical protein